jgi:hypothetical protein
LIGAGLLLLAFATTASAQTWRTVSSSRQLHGESELNVSVNYGAGRFTLLPASSGTLYRMDLRYDEERVAPLREFDAASGTLRLGVRSLDRGNGVRVSLGDRRRGDPPPTLDIALTRDVPLNLELNLGAVQADVDLTGLSLRSVQFRTGASETRVRFGEPNPVACDELDMQAGAAAFTVTGIANANCRRLTFSGGVGDVTLDFTGEWRQPMAADINVSIGSLNLRIPRDVAVSIRLNRFLASFEQRGFTKRGSTYYSSNWDSARHRLTLDVRAAIGGVDVVWVGN